MVAIPDRFEKRIGETEIEDVLHRLLAEVVVDPEDRFLGKRPEQGYDQSACRRQITTGNRLGGIAR